MSASSRIAFELQQIQEGGDPQAIELASTVIRLREFFGPAETAQGQVDAIDELVDFLSGLHGAAA